MRLKEAREAVLELEVARVDQDAQEAMREGLNRAMRVREQLDDAQVRGQVRQRVERRCKGWRSSASLWCQV